MILPKVWRKLSLLFRNCFSIFKFLLEHNFWFSNPNLKSQKESRLCRYATYYVGRRYMRKHARILHTLLWLMHQLSQSRKRCCISTFFITISTKITTMKVPFHQYTITARWVILKFSNRIPIAVRSRKVQVIHALDFLGQVFYSFPINNCFWDMPT